MWIFSKVGFYSVVQKSGQSYLTVRSRAREDLENLRATYMPGLSLIMAGGGTDYPYRALISHKHFANGLVEMGNDIHYSNFKNEVASNDMARAHVYGNVWSNMLNTEKQHHEEAALKRLSVGGVVFNEYDEILLIEPTGHFDGYVWTFPKGSPNKGESFENAGKREVLEETGVVAEIVGLVPGQFDGGTTVNSYFIMRTTGSEGPIESTEVMNTAWVSSGRAAAMISQTTNDKGKQRDLDILKAAIGVKDLLSTNAGSIKAPPRFPAGNYIVVIESFEMLPFSWKKSGTHGLSYVPKVRAVSCVELDDDSNPELQTEMQEALDKYGDWTNRSHEFAYNSSDTNKRMAAVSSINFPLIETDADHEEAIGILEKMAWRFYMNEDNVESGFVVDVLGLSNCQDDSVIELAEKTIGCKFMVDFEYEPNQDPTRQPNFAIAGATQA